MRKKICGIVGSFKTLFIPIPLGPYLIRGSENNRVRGDEAIEDNSMLLKIAMSTDNSVFDEKKPQFPKLGITQNSTGKNLAPKLILPHYGSKLVWVCRSLGKGNKIYCYFPAERGFVPFNCNDGRRWE